MSGTDIFHADLAQLDRATETELAPFDLILGHFTFQHVAKFRQKKFLFTLLREPVDRVVSTYFFARKQAGAMPPNADHESPVVIGAAGELSLAEFLLSDNPAIRALTSNTQSKILAFDHRPDQLGSISDIKGAALRNLEEFDFVGITEHFDDSIRVLSEKRSLSVPIVP